MFRIVGPDVAGHLARVLFDAVPAAVIPCEIEEDNLKHLIRVVRWLPGPNIVCNYKYMSETNQPHP